MSDVSDLLRFLYPSSTPGDLPGGAAQSFDIALEHHRAGRKHQAYELCLEVLKVEPQHHEALFLVGSVDLESGRWDSAVERLERAIQVVPDCAAYHCSNGLAHWRRGDRAKAASALVRSVQLDPEVAESSYHLGLLALEQNDVENAIVCLGRAADLKPEILEVHCALAQALRARGDLERAVAHLHCALVLEPKSAEVCLELVVVLTLLGRVTAAEGMARRALSINPSLAAPHVMLGDLMFEQGKFDAAIEHFTLALGLKHRTSSMLTTLGSALMRVGRIDDAVSCLRHAVESNPADAVAHSGLVYTAAFHPRCSAADNLREAALWAERHERPLLPKRWAHARDVSPNRRLSVGYVSPNFDAHCQRFFLAPLLSHHDHAAYEVVCYSSVPQADEVTHRLQQYADVWHDVQALSDAELAERIREDGIDILVDLTMHMSGSRLKTFAEKPAPVQICWLAYPGTTGLSGMDYRISDPHLDPPGVPGPYTEETLRLPHTFWCYDPWATEPEVSALPAASAGRVTFGCLNDFCKVHGGVLALWAQVLAAVPGSQLLMLAPPGSARRLVVQVLGQHGVLPERVQFVDRQAHADYLKTYGRIDVGLDCFPVNGHTTSLDSFWMGVPVVTLVGDAVLGRAGLCHSHNLGLPQLAAQTPEQFVRAAVELSGDLDRLSALRQALRGRMQASPLMDAPRFTRDLEAAFRRAWQGWCERASTA